MSPEQLQQFEQLKSKVQTLEEENHKLKASTTIPYDVDQAFRTRLAGTLGVTVSAKGVDTEDQAVAEGGSATYNVLKEPDLFLEISIGGTTYYLPAFT